MKKLTFNIYTENDFDNMLPSTVFINYYNVSSSDTFISVTENPAGQLTYSEINGHISMIFPIIKDKTFRIWFNTSDITMKFI